MLFTNSGFALDFTNHLWLSWAAGKELFETGHPVYFLNTSGLGVFYPMFAFYGGTLYTLTGAIGHLLGHPVFAYVAVTIIAIAGAYTGTLWLARQLGVQGWLAHAPALTVITSAYFVTDLYGRGAWPELLAVSAMAPLMASGVSLVRAPRLQPLSMTIFVISAVIFSGSHNLTLLWGTTITTLAVIVIWLALGASLRLPYRRLATLAGLGVASVLVNAWFLFPDIAYEGKVEISNEGPTSWAATSFLNTPGVLLDPLRHSADRPGAQALFVQIPDWFLAWGLVAGTLLLWSRPLATRLRRVWLAGVVVIAALLVMVMLAPFWKIVPFPFNRIQFPYRLGAYIVYAIAGLVVVGVLAVQRASRTGARQTAVTRLRIGLAIAVVISLALCVWQAWVPNTLVEKSYADRNEALFNVNTLPLSWYDGGAYRDVSAPIVAVPDERFLTIEPRLVHSDRFDAWLSVPPGPAPIRTNINGGGYLVDIRGLDRVGGSPDGEVVVKRPHGVHGRVHVVIETAPSTPVELGRAVSGVAVLLISIALALAFVRASRARRAQRRKPNGGDAPERVRATAG
jgi:hypothetical protein